MAGVFLTNSDLDHVLGVFSLREGKGLDIYASSATRRVADSCLGLETVLKSFCGSSWHEPSTTDFTPLAPESGPGKEVSRVESSNLRNSPSRRRPSQRVLLYRAIELPGKPPPFAGTEKIRQGHSLAYQFKDPETGGRLLVAPDVAEINQGLREALATSDAVLFDGTFWSADELAKVRPGAQKASEMGHVTIRDGSLELLRQSPASTKVYIHINNTNPILAAKSAERAAVEAAGIKVGWDGFEFDL